MAITFQRCPGPEEDKAAWKRFHMLCFEEWFLNQGNPPAGYNPNKRRAIPMLLQRNGEWVGVVRLEWRKLTGYVPVLPIVLPEWQELGYDQILLRFAHEHCRWLNQQRLAA